VLVHSRTFTESLVTVLVIHAHHNSFGPLETMTEGL
jgi:hypothetical protein